MEQDNIFRIALTKVPHIGSVQGKLLIETFGDATAVFKTKKSLLEKVDGIGQIRADAIKRFSDFASCEKELKFIEQQNIQCLFYTEENYPHRLRHCHDAPIILFFKGNANCNASRILAVVGTRSNTFYGKDVCETIIEDLKNHDIMIVSGLAYGIDTIAHKAALKNNMPTVAVLAHGLDRIYPYQNKSLALKMLEQGGLITSFVSQTNPDKQNFPSRNRITAGMADALLVVETGEKGGSLITAEIAFSYHKEIFAVPGRVNDPKSAGCLRLIKNQKAILVESAADIIQNMAWGDQQKQQKKQQLSLFHELTEAQQQVISHFKNGDTLHIEKLIAATGFAGSALASALLSLEMLDILECLPGKKYRIK